MHCFANDPDAAGFAFSAQDNGLVFRVLRLEEDDAAWQLDHAFEGGLVIDEDGGDFAAADIRLLVDENNIPIVDIRACHAIALAGEAEIGLDVLRYGYEIGYVLLRQYRIPALNHAQKRKQPGRGEGGDTGGADRWDAWLPSDVIKSYVKHVC